NNKFELGVSSVFERNKGFPVPRWWLVLSTRVRYALVDKDANRIVDYVNLNNASAPLDVTAKLMEGKDCNVDPSTDFASNPGSQWCTNRLDGSDAIAAPTYGIMNQILAGVMGVPN